MFRLFEFIMHGCWHKWKRVKVYSLYDADLPKNIPVGERQIFECEKCGRRKKHDVR